MLGHYSFSRMEWSMARHHQLSLTCISTQTTCKQSKEWDPWWLSEAWTLHRHPERFSVTTLILARFKSHFLEIFFFFCCSRNIPQAPSSKASRASSGGKHGHGISKFLYGKFLHSCSLSASILWPGEKERWSVLGRWASINKHLWILKHGAMSVFKQ